MSLATAIVAHLKAHAGLSALVGTRIYPDRNPVNNPVYPYIVYHRIGNAREYSTGAGTAIWAKPRYQIDCCDDDHDEADAVGVQLLAALNNLGKTTLGVAPNTYVIESCMAVDDVGPEFESTREDPHKGVWIRKIDFRIQHNE